MNRITRRHALCVAALLVGPALATGCADEGPAIAPGALMAVADELPAAPTPAEASPAIAAPPADHPAYAAAETATPNRTERTLGIDPVPQPAADAPPLRVAFTSTRRTSSLGSSEPTMDADAPIPSSAGCAGGLRGLSSEFPWGGSKGGVWQGTGHPDPEPLREVGDAEMLALAGDVGLDSVDREHALVSVGRRKVPGALAAFRDGLAPSQPHPVREMALSGLIEHGGAAALKLMWRALTDDPSAHIRGMAIWAIALYGPDEALKAISTGLGDPTYEVQGMAILAVWALNDRPAVALPILEAAAKADERLLWQEGLNVLARMPYSDAGNLLREIGLKGEGEKRNSAVFYYRQWRQAHPDLCK